MTRALTASVALVVLTATPLAAYSERSTPTMTVKRGDVLSDLAKDWPGGYLRAAYVNDLASPDLIVAGDVLLIPRRDGRRYVPPRPTQKASRSWTPRPSGTPSSSDSSSASRSYSSASAGSHNWDAVAACESGGDWQANTGNGYYGGLQHSLSTWRAYGGTGYPHEHSREAQIAVAERVLAGQGPGAWPTCGAYL